MGSFELEVCRRLPLAEAVWRMWGWVCEPVFLEDLFERHRGRSYTRELTFGNMVQLMADALLQHEGSGHQSWQRAEEAGTLATSIRAVYGKLSRMPIEVSMALLREGTGRVRALFPEDIIGSQLPESLAELEWLVHDGKKIKHVEKRLAVLRGLNGQILGGKLVVTQSLNTGMALVMAVDEDGEAGDQPLVPSVLEQLRPVCPGPRVHVGDRMFCDLQQAQLFRAEGDHFLLRWNAKVSFHRDDAWETLTSVDRYGRTVHEDWGWIGKASDPRRCAVRRITVTRAEGGDLVLITTLSDPEQFPADDLLEVYLKRWSIENMFQQVTEVFHLQDLIGSTPSATVFQAAFCFLLYNMIQVVRAWIASGQELSPHEISTDQLFQDVHRQLTSWTEVLSPQTTVELLNTPQTAPKIRRHLQQLLHPLWEKRWRKTPSHTHKNLPPPRSYIPGGHTSVARQLRQNR